MPLVAANSSTSGAPMMWTALSSGAVFHTATSGRSDTKRWSCTSHGFHCEASPMAIGRGMNGTGCAGSLT